jgi:hypothetical protein
MITQYSNTQLRNTQYRDLLPTVFSLGKPYFWGMASQVEKDVSNYVSKMIDMSGNGNDVIQGTQIYKPLWVDDELNGYPVLSFNGSQWLRVQYPTPLYQPITVFAVWKVTTAGAYSFCFDNFSSTYFGLYGTNTSIAIQVGAGPVGYTKSVPFDFLLNTAVFNSASSSLYENGVLKKTGAVASSNLTGITLGNAFNFSAPFIGEIAEVLIYDAVLHADNRISIETYLINKYGL